MNRNMKFILAAAIAMTTAATVYSATPETQSWLIQSRSSGKYVYEDSGSYKTAETPSCEDFVWTIEAAGPEMIRLRNAGSGNCICLDADGSVVPGQGDDVWKITGFPYSNMRSVGWYRLYSPGCGEGDGHAWLKEEDGTLKYGGADESEDRNHHWTLVRRDGTSIPYVLDGNSVTESSFMGLRKAEAVSDTEIRSDWHGDNTWKLSRDISDFPKFTMKEGSLVPALYNMALEEMLMDIRKDSTFCAGASWPDTWTRDAVYSIWFSYAWILPDISRKTLEKQTLKNPAEALQDTGTGGSWPISTDRVVWALAAWEYYLVAGEKEWLEYAYEGLRNTALKDLHVAYDPEVKLFRGETASMDWRTHTYPDWFTNAHIGESYSAGTNSLHLFMYRFLGKAGEIIGAPEEEMNLWKKTETDLTEGINAHFWNPEKNLYDCWLYPAFMDYAASDRVAVMANGLAAMCGAASRQQTAAMVKNYPLYPYGAAVLWPSKPDGFAYHNKGIWPVWQTPLMYAAKETGNVAVLDHLMKSMTRSAALFLTHKENWTYDTGYDRNTALNSDRQLWSVASYISMVYRILFGMELHEDGVSFHPVVPEYFGGTMKLEGMKYRKAVLNLTVNGYGDKVSSIKVNGRSKSPDWTLPANARGRYNIVIVMEDSGHKGKATIVGAGPGFCWAPEEPTVSCENGTLIWSQTPDNNFLLYGNGESGQIWPPYDLNKKENGFWSIRAVDENGMTSDLSNPVLKTTWTARYEAEDFVSPESVCSEHTGYSGRGYVQDNGSSHKDLEIVFEVPQDGDYILWFTGANGHGPHDVYCTIRSLFVDGADTATVFLEAYGDWNVWTSSNHVILKGLKAGKHTAAVRFNPENKGFDNNMSWNKANLNDWNIDYMTVSAL